MDGKPKDIVRSPEEIAAIRVIVSRVNHAIKGRRVDLIGAALATVVAEICVVMSKDNIDVAFGGVDSLCLDAKVHVHHQLVKNKQTGTVN